MDPNPTLTIGATYYSDWGASSSRMRTHQVAGQPSPLDLEDLHTALDRVVLNWIEELNRTRRDLLTTKEPF